MASLDQDGVITVEGDQDLLVKMVSFFFDGGSQSLSERAWESAASLHPNSKLAGVSCL